MRELCFQVLLLWTLGTVAGQPPAWGSAAAGNLGSAPDRAAKGTAKEAVGFELYHDYMIVLRGAAGPAKGLNFLLDTGATPSVLTPRLAAKLHLEVVGEDIAVLNETVRGGRATVPELQVGPVRKQNLPVLIEDLGFLQKQFPLQIDGIVGLDVLGTDAFVIDYATREIRFGDLPAMRDSIPLEMKGGLAFVEATVDHAPVHLLFDTGAPSLILFEQTAVPVAGSKISGPLPPPKPIGEFDRKHVQTIRVRLGDTEFGRESAFVVHNPGDAGHGFDGLMSPAALGITRVAVDVARGTLAFAREP
ncbi:MAG TPA: retropepsin-like aspartic protease [Acidobacteriaceae bacterium]